MMGSFKQVFLLLTHSLAIEVDTENPDLNKDREDKIPRLQDVTWDAPHKPCGREKYSSGWRHRKASLSFPTPPCPQIQKTSIWLFFS